MKKTTALLLTVTAISLAACGDDRKPIEQAKNLKGEYAAILEKPTPSPNDIEFIKQIQANNDRRVKSMLSNGSVQASASNEFGQTGLMVASSLKYESIVDYILEAESMTPEILNRGDYTGKTALMYAAETAGDNIVRKLRKKGANPNLFDKSMNFALLFAVKANSLTSAEEILKDVSGSTPANPSLQNGEGRTAVIEATIRGNKEILQLLKDYGANFNTTDVSGGGPLYYAVKSKNRELADYILSLGADINFIGQSERSILSMAIADKNHEFVQYLLEKGADPNAHRKGLPSPLQIAVSNENADPQIIEALIAKGAKLNSPDMPAGNVIGRSIHKGNAKAIEVLIKHGAKVSDIETATSSGVLEALNIEDPEIAVIMINNGSDISKMNDSGFSPLAIAARKNFPTVFEALVKKGADVNQTSRNNNASPLEIVVGNNDAALLELMYTNGLTANADALLLKAASDRKAALIPVLLKHGARPNIMNNTGQPALWLAVAQDDIDSVKALAEAGTLLDVQDENRGLSPLSLAIARNNTDIATYLIEKGAKPDLVDKNGYTALTYAAASGQTELVRSLVAKGAEVNAVDSSGNTILEIVTSSKLPKEKKDELKNILVGAGAKER